MVLVLNSPKANSVRVGHLTGDLEFKLYSWPLSWSKASFICGDNQQWRKLSNVMFRLIKPSLRKRQKLNLPL